MHPKVLAHVQRSDPQEYHFIHRPETMTTSYQIFHAQSRARTAPANIQQNRAWHKTSGFVTNQMGYVPTQPVR